MKSTVFVLLLSLFSCNLCTHDTEKGNGKGGPGAEYMAGAAKVSIEPGNSTFSLALGGYAAPYEGRFTISWQWQETLQDNVVDMTGDGRYLFAVTSPGILKSKDTGNDSGWIAMGDAVGISKIAVSQNKLYGLSADGRVLESDLDIVSWRPAESTGDVPPFGVEIYGERAYRLSDDSILYQRDDSYPDARWTKIGYKNYQTCTIDIKDIAVAGERLYAIDKNNKLYIARHSTKGDLYATALAVSSAGETVVLVGLDLIGFDYPLVKLIKDEVRRTKGIPSEAIMINASHTHFSPVTQAWPTWAEHAQRPDSVYLKDIVVKNTLQAIYLALDDMKESTISFGRTESVIGANRALSGVDALYDPTVDILTFESTDGKNKDVFFLASCHPVFQNSGTESFTLSANFPGVAKKILEQNREQGITQAVFFQGCAGDVNPLDIDNARTGTTLAADVLAALDRPMEQLHGGISCALDSVMIPVSPWSRGEVENFKAENAGRPGDMYAERNVRWADMMLSYYDNRNMPEYMPVYIQTINIGEWKLVGLSREAVSEYALSIRELWPGRHVSVAAFCNDISSYLPNAAHVGARNYEGYDSSIWYGMPGFFPENILETVVNHIKASNN